MSDGITALMDALDCSHGEASLVIERLEANGFTVYKKKVYANPKRPVSSLPMNRRVASQIRKFYQDNPDKTQSQIAAHFNVNSGRVSEAINGLG